MLNFPGASSNEILHYIDVRLKEKLIDTVMIHVGVNNLLNGNSQLKVNQLIENIVKITEKCVSFGFVYIDNRNINVIVYIKTVYIC